MSTAKPATIASAPEREAGLFLKGPFLKINPDILIACAFAAVGILLAACAAVAFPQISEAWAW
jgi:hypothetical protein